MLIFEAVQGGRLEYWVRVISVTARSSYRTVPESYCWDPRIEARRKSKSGVRGGLNTIIIAVVPEEICIFQTKLLNHLDNLTSIT